MGDRMMVFAKIISGIFCGLAQFVAVGLVAKLNIYIFHYEVFMPVAFSHGLAGEECGNN